MGLLRDLQTLMHAIQASFEYVAVELSVNQTIYRQLEELSVSLCMC